MKPSEMLSEILWASIDWAGKGVKEGGEAVIFSPWTLGSSPSFSGQWEFISARWCNGKSVIEFCPPMWTVTNGIKSGEESLLIWFEWCRFMYMSLLKPRHPSSPSLPLLNRIIFSCCCCFFFFIKIKGVLTFHFLHNSFC